jgi:preprotein translocase subunit SecY
MWIRILKVLSNKRVMLRFGITLAIIAVMRFLSYVTVPLFDTESITAFIESSGSFIAILNNFSGQALSRFSVMALGISPYITASIAIQLLQMVIPSFKEWSEQGDSGKRKLNQITRYIAIGLAFIQGFALIIGISVNGSVIIPSIEASVVTQYRYFFYFYMALVIAGGTAISIFLADLITKKGVGNGTSMLIVAGIVTSLPSMWTTVWNKYISNPVTDSFLNYVWFVVIILIYVGVLLGVVFMQAAVRKIPVQYANRQGKSDSNIPMKINSSGVIPVIFAQTLLSIPLTIVGLASQNGTTTLTNWITSIFTYNQPIGFILYVILIVVFSFFYAFLMVNPHKISNNLSKGNAYVPGIRPGEDTKDYIAKLLFKITVIGTTYLVILAIMPIITSLIFGFNATEAQAITLGGTSLLIIVGVALQTTEQLETDANQETYSGLFS